MIPSPEERHAMETLKRAERDIETVYKRRPCRDAAVCSCHVCEALGNVADALWHLRQAQQETPATEV
jgi:hypothetical protein